MVKTLIVDEQTQTAKVNQIKSRFAYQYVDHPENVFSFNGQYLTSPLVRLATMTPEDLSHLGETVTSEYVEKINRHVHTIGNFKLDISGHLPPLGTLSSEDVQVTFRAGGDYVCKLPCGKESYGSKLNASDFTENGFNVRMFNGTLIQYTLKA